jgi:hypothetical protein
MMAKINLEFDADNKLQAKADSDDFTDSYMLGRQVAHEYYSSAVQSFITAESAARQVELEAQKDEVDRFREDKSKKQTEGKAAEKVFADTMVETMQRRQGGTEGKGSGKVAPEGGGGGWGEEDAPKSMPGAVWKSRWWTRPWRVLRVLQALARWRWLRAWGLSRASPGR